MPSFLAPAQSSLSVFTEFIVGQRYPLTTVITIMLPVLYSLVELMAFILLWRSARARLAHDISLQMCVALAVGPTIATVVDVSYWFVFESLIRQTIDLSIGWWILVLAPATVAGAAWFCVFTLYKQGFVHDEDDSLVDIRRPRWMRWGAPYVVAAAITALVTGAVCHLTDTSLASLKHFELLATFMNFLHGVALLPQLVLSRRKGFVAPTAVRFLLLVGFKHIMEFAIDYNTARFIGAGSAPQKDAGCLLGDLLTAVLLLDFIYLWSMSTYKVGVKRGMKSAFDLKIVV